MNTKAYTVLGWVTWQVASRVAKRKMARNKVKLGAAATLLLLLIGGIGAARALGGNGDS
jgi:hypothetical protein